jgi:hypothetical protein
MVIDMTDKKLNKKGKIINAVLELIVFSLGTIAGLYVTVITSGMWSIVYGFITLVNLLGLFYTIKDLNRIFNSV